MNSRPLFKINYSNKNMLKNNSISLKNQINEKMKENLNFEKSIILKKELKLSSKLENSNAVIMAKTSEKNEIVKEIKHILKNMQHTNEQDKIDKINDSNKGNKNFERENSISRNFKKQILEIRINQKKLGRSVNLEKNAEMVYGRKASEIDAKVKSFGCLNLNYFEYIHYFIYVFIILFLKKNNIL